MEKRTQVRMLPARTFHSLPPPKKKQNQQQNTYVRTYTPKNNLHPAPGGPLHGRGTPCLPSPHPAVCVAVSHFLLCAPGQQAKPRVFASLPEALAADPDGTLFSAVDVMVPNWETPAEGDLHEHVAMMVLKAGRHLLLEKPISVTVEAGQRLGVLQMMMMMALVCLSKRTPLLTHFLAHSSHSADNQVFECAPDSPSSHL